MSTGRDYGASQSSLAVRARPSPLGSHNNARHSGNSSYGSVASTIDDREQDGRDQASDPGARRERAEDISLTRAASVSLGHRHHGALKASNSLYEELVNKQMPLEDSAYMVKCFEKGVDGRLQRTYLEGQALLDIYGSAVVPKVGLTFLPGADRAQVTRIEQTNMAGKDPDQKDAAWRVNTAGSLLMQFNVSTDLSIFKIDQTRAVVAQTINRQQRHETFSSDSRRALIHRGRCPSDAVTIDSDEVKIVNDLREGNWDLQSTLIEGKLPYCSRP